MARVLATLTLALLGAGCAHAYSSRLIVSAPPAEELALRPSDVVPAGDPRLTPNPGPTRPTLTTNASTWRTYGAGAVLSDTERVACRKHSCLARARRKSNLVGGGLIAASVLYGFGYFDFGTSGWHVKDDGWFEKDSSAGGADKLGHAVTAHIETCALAAIYRSWGIPRKEAALRGAIAAWTAQLAIEIGDGFAADFGFSWRDIVANTAGAFFGYLHSTNPRFQRLFDFRWEYWPSERFGEEELEGEDTGGGIATDYEGSTYVLAVNLGAVYSRRSNLLDFVDFQLAWRSRGYVDPTVKQERTVLIGVGLNLTTVCNRLGLPKLGKVFQFYQLPGTSLRLGIDLD